MAKNISKSIKIVKINKKLFLGPLGSALNAEMKKRMEKEGYEVTTCCFIKTPFEFSCDINLEINKLSYFNAVASVLKNFFNSLGYDIYNFRFGQSLLPWNLDLPILKLLGKKVIMIFNGSDIRQLDRFQNDKYNRILVGNLKRKNSKFKDFRRRFRVWWVSRFSNEVVVTTPDLLQFAPNAKFIPNFAPLSTMVKPVKKELSKTILVLHIPTNRDIKGSIYVIRAVKKLQKEKLPIKLLLIEKIPHNQVASYYQKADIVVDQLLIGAYGVVSIEAMMFGKATICYIREDLRKKYPADLPIISANPDNIYEVLKDLVNHRTRIKKFGLLGPRYIKKHLSPEIIVDKWKKIYEK